VTISAIEGLRANHEDLQAVLASVTDAEWAQDSACAGWRIQDVLAHVTSNFKEMIEPTPPPADPPQVPSMTAEQAMEALVAPRKEWTAAQLLAEYAQYRDAAFAALEALQAEPLASTETPLADLGTYQLHWLANAYCFDHYCHLRHDLLAPEGPLQRDLPEPDDARLRPGVEWMWAGLPQMCSPALTHLDRPLLVVLTGPGGGSWLLGPAGADGLITVEEVTGGAAPGAAATVTSSAHAFVSWGTKRSNWRDHSTVTGDADYAAAVLDALNIV